MTKARTVGQKKRGRGRPKKEGVDREPNGRAVRSTARRDDAQATALSARSRILGVPEPTDPVERKAWRARFRAEHMGCVAGRAIDQEPDCAELWTAIKAIASVYARWHRSIGAVPYPKAAKLEIAEEIRQDGVDVSEQADLRTDEERARAAANAMMWMEQILGSAGYGVASQVKATVLQDEAPHHRDRYLVGLRAVVKAS